MSGVQVNGLTDFVLMTSPAYVTGPKMLLNESAKVDYPMLRRFTKGRDAMDMLQGGNSIRDQIVLQDSNTASDENFGSTLTYTNPNLTSEISAPWRRKVEKGLTWTDAEILLQGTANMTTQAAYKVYKELYFRKEQTSMVSLLNSLEGDFWNTPNTTQMEAAGGLRQYSIPALVNEYVATATDGVATATTSNATNTLFNPGTSEDATVWTTVHGVSPATYSYWRNKTFTYQSAAVNNAANVFVALGNAYRQLVYIPPPSAKEYFESTTLFGQVIYTSAKGCAHYEDLLRQSNDRLLPGYQDPAYPGPQFRGIEVAYVPQLDTALLYANAANASTGARVTEGQSAIQRGPRYYMLNLNYMKLWVHAERYFFRHEPMRDSIQPDTWKRPIELWRNMLARSRARQAVVFPTTTVFSAY